MSPCSESGGEGTYQHHEEKTLARSEHTVDESDGQRLVHGDLVVVDRLEPREARLQHADIYPVMLENLLRYSRSIEHR